MVRSIVECPIASCTVRGATPATVTGDAAFCQRELCKQIVDSGGDYLFVVKDNQPELKAAVEAEFQPGFSPRHGKASTSVAV